MATQRSASVPVVNATGGNAWILLFHNNSSNGTQSASWMAEGGQTVGPMKVYFETGFGTEGIYDYWSVLVHVKDGPNAGFYVNSGSDLDRYWKECQLQDKDANQLLTFTVSATELTVTLDSGGCAPEPMTKLTPQAPITHVFVVMLENHSFDNVFAMSGIEGIIAASTSNSNSYDGVTYPVQPSAPLSLPTDPGHEFLDTLEQLGGPGASYQKGGLYPPITSLGFAANYATSTTEGPAPTQDEIHDIMACFATRDQLPVIYQLATQFAICDQWFSSLPGPTWPNRFFLHGASSAGLDDSPSKEEMIGWEVPGGGFKYPNGSIYQALSQAGIPYRFYNDSTEAPAFQSLFSDNPQQGSAAGAIPQVSSLSGVTLLDVQSLRHFATDLQGPYPYPYTFIEPHYGDIVANTYAGGSSEHPKDDMYGGERLLASVYSAIRSSPYWNTSLLVVVYDEHGGFYDSAKPPGGAAAPGDDPHYGYSRHGFDFQQYGVRVPAVLVSPLIPAGTVDHTLYDHSSVLKTVEKLWGLKALTQRDENAQSFLHLLSPGAPRSDAPLSIAAPPPLLRAAKPPMTVAERADSDAQPVPRAGNLVGVLGALKKAEGEMSTGTPAEAAAIHARFEKALQSRGDARDYIESAMAKVGSAKVQRHARFPQRK